MIYGDVLNKLRRYCAYQERCHEEVRTKLLSLKIYGDDLEEVINALIEEDFLNEERFAKAYAGGKFRMKKWGRLKIIRELKLRKISDYCIRKAMEEIPEEDYIHALNTQIRAARKAHPGLTDFEKNHVIAKRLIAKGYEPELVWSALKPARD